MSIIVPNVGLATLLDDLTAVWGTVDIHLYDNNYVPVHGSVVGDFNEASFSGYAPVAVTSWSPAAPTGVDHEQSTGSTVQWAAPGVGLPINLYGYYATDPGGNLLFAERFPSPPVVLSIAGQVLSITIVFTDASEF